MELQTAFYVIAIIYMIVGLVLFSILLAAVLYIRSKINHFSDMVEERIDQVQSVSTKAIVGLNALKYFMKLKR
jgi:hypothetical protein